MKKYLKAILFLTFATAYAVILPKIRIRNDELESFLFSISDHNQARQIAVVCIMFIMGIPGAHFITRRQNDSRRTILYALPFSCVCWSVFSIFCLTIGIAYSLRTMFLMFLLMDIFFCILVRNEMRSLLSDLTSNFSYLLVSFGIILMLSTGFVITWLDSDGYYFITMLGKTLASQGKILPEMEWFLTHIFLGGSTFSSLSYMAGADNFYVLHHALVFDSWAIFYLLLKNKRANSKLDVLYFLFIISLPMTVILSVQLISNTYVMVSLIWLIDWTENINGFTLSEGDKLFFVLISIYIAMLRPDTMIVLCVVSFGIAWAGLKALDVICFFLLPSFCSWMIWMIKVKTTTLGYEGDYINSKTIILIGALALMTCGAIVLTRYTQIFKAFHRKLFWVGVPVIFTALLSVFFREASSRVLDVFKYNLSKFPHPIAEESGFWGLSVIFFFVLIWFIHVFNRIIPNVYEILFMWLFFVTYNIGLLRGTLLNSYPRGGLGDSFNRNLLSYLPLLYYGLYISIIDLEKKRLRQMDE